MSADIETPAGAIDRELVPAVRVEGVSKKFRIVSERNQSLKSVALRRKRVSYEELWALRDITFDVPRGSTFGIIGSNGSGKSTLLKCLAHILRPDEGTITAEGKTSALLELGAGFHPELSGRENVFLNGAILGLSERELSDRFDDIVGFAGLERFIDEPVKNYSSGMYVRLGFSVAINVDPDILVVDEVLAVGDVNFQRRCNDKFDEFQRAGKTVIVVSHALERIKSMCDQVAWIERGELQMVGDSAEVCDAYTVGMMVRAREEGRAAQETVDLGADESSLIDRVELFEADGSVADVVFVGKPLHIRVRYDNRRAPTQVVVGISIVRDDGMHVADVNAGWQFASLADHDGMVTVEYAIPALPLLKGRYSVGVTLHDDTVLKVYDRDDHAAEFSVIERGPVPESGLVALEGNWSAATDG